MAEAYCVKDKMKVEVQNPQKITMKNGKPAIQGTCPKCGGKVFRIGALTVLDLTRRPTPAGDGGGRRFPAVGSEVPIGPGPPLERSPSTRADRPARSGRWSRGRMPRRRRTIGGAGDRTGRRRSPVPARTAAGGPLPHPIARGPRERVAATRRNPR